jgi:NAD(P)-dependent dehydrogenase (short-subunit alcohol dehydrogenase family)
MNLNTKKVAFITGGSRGIGKSVAERFKKEGWLVAICGTVESRLDKTSADLRLSCDVSRADQVKSGVQKILNSFGRIDVVVNNAGIAQVNSLDPDASDELWHRIIDVNLNGTYLVCKSVIPHLPNGHGRIINIASVLALRGVSDLTAYCAAKHGVLGLTRSLAHSLAPRKITVNAICPGWVGTGMAESRAKEIGVPVESLKKNVPLGRLIEATEIADLVFFVASSEASSMMTGQALTIDGGVLA